MTTSYSPKLQLALPATGDLDGTWGDVVNLNITAMIEEAIAGVATISSWTAASHTLTTANGTTSEARCAILLLSGAPGAACEVITPATSKVYIIKNDVTGGYIATVKVTGMTGVDIPNGATVLVYCNGTDIVSAFDSPSFTGTPIAPTPALGDNDTSIATTAFAMTMQSPAFSGTPTVPTAALGTSTTQTASTAFAMTMQSPAFSGNPTAPTPALGDNDTSIATTAFAMTMQSPAFSGTPTVPTAANGTASTQAASTLFVANTVLAVSLPAQTGNQYKFIQSDGVNASWQYVPLDPLNYLLGVI